MTYGRAVRGADGRTWLQYWFLYADNPQDRGIVRTGRHEGDWEVVQVRLGPGGRPDAATYAQHSWAAGVRLARRRLRRPRLARLVPDAPASTGGRGPTRTTRRPGTGASVRPEVRPFGAWVALAGAVGAHARPAGCPAEAPSPRGPAFQPDGAVARPGGFHARGARLRGRRAAASLAGLRVALRALLALR